MAISAYLSTITLNINRLNAPIKRHWVAEWIKKHEPSIYMLLTRDSLCMCQTQTGKWRDGKGYSKQTAPHGLEMLLMWLAPSHSSDLSINDPSSEKLCLTASHPPPRSPVSINTPLSCSFMALKICVIMCVCVPILVCLPARRGALLSPRCSRPF